MSDLEQTDLAPLLAVLDRYASLRIWVVGDLMLDEYVMGAVDRVSPEAPVPVVRVRDTEHRLGGAANVARQVAALGARVTLCGTIGTDGAGDDLLRLCAASGIDTRAVVRTVQTAHHPQTARARAQSAAVAHGLGGPRLPVARTSATPCSQPSRRSGRMPSSSATTPRACSPRRSLPPSPHAPAALQWS